MPAAYLLGSTAASAPFVTSNLFARPALTTLRHASFGAGGMAWSDLTQIANCKNVEIVAICDVDLAQTVEARKQFPKARFYQDWRGLLDKEAKNIDSVNISTPTTCMRLWASAPCNLASISTVKNPSRTICMKFAR